MRVSKATRQRIADYPDRVAVIGENYGAVTTAAGTVQVFPSKDVYAEAIRLRKWLRDYELGLKVCFAECCWTEMDIMKDVPLVERTAGVDAEAAATLVGLKQQLMLLMISKRGCEMRLNAVHDAQRALRTALAEQDTVQLTLLDELLRSVQR